MLLYSPGSSHGSHSDEGRGITGGWSKSTLDEHSKLSPWDASWGAQCRKEPTLQSHLASSPTLLQWNQALTGILLTYFSIRWCHCRTKPSMGLKTWMWILWHPRLPPCTRLLSCNQEVPESNNLFGPGKPNPIGCCQMLKPGRDQWPQWLAPMPARPKNVPRTVWAKEEQPEQEDLEATC